MLNVVSRAHKESVVTKSLAHKESVVTKWKVEFNINFYSFEYICNFFIVVVKLIFVEIGGGGE